MSDDKLSHTAPADDGYSQPVTKLEEMFGADVLERPDLYSGVVDDELLDQLRRVVDGAAEVRIYRAVPPGVATIRTGDWVTLSRSYAAQHGVDAIDPAKDWPVLSAKVPVHLIFTDGNDLNEYGYTGSEISGDVS